MFEFLTRDHEDSISDYGDNDNDRTIESQTTERDTAEFEVFFVEKSFKIRSCAKVRPHNGLAGYCSSSLYRKIKYK